MIEFSDFKKPVREAAVVVALACALGFAANLVHPGGYRFVPPGEPALDGIVRIDAAEAGVKFDRGSAFFIDTRPAAEFRESGIPGATNLPGRPESSALAAIKANAALFERPLEPVIYCSGEACDSAEDFARVLVSTGYRRSVYVLSGGLSGWQAMGYPVRMNEGENTGR